MLKLGLLLLALSAPYAMAQDLVLDTPFPSISRTTGGKDYVITLNQPSKSLTLTLEAVLNDPNSSAQKLLIHSVKARSASGVLTTVQGKTFLTAAASKLSVNVASVEVISAIIIKAESYGAIQRLETFIEGDVYVDQEAARRRAEEEARRAQDEAARRAQDEAARRAADEAARRAADEAARRAQDEAARAAEFRRQQDCSVRIMPTQRDLMRCEDELKQVVRDLRQSERTIDGQQRELSQLEAPIRACNGEANKLENALDGIRNTLAQQKQAFDSAKNQVSGLVAQHQNALRFGTQWECVMSDVGHRNFNRGGKGRYVGRGPTPGKALEEAMKTCPMSNDDGCGKNDDLRADITCRAL